MKCFRCGYGRMLRFTDGVKCYQCGARPADENRPVWSNAERKVAEAGEKAVMGIVSRTTSDPQDGHRTRRRNPRLSPNGIRLGRPARQLTLAMGNN